MRSNKKLIVLSAALLTLVLVSFSASADVIIATIQAQFNPSIKLLHNGIPVTLPSDQPIIMYNDRTYVPLRAVSGLVGADISWDDASSTVVLDNKTGISLGSSPLIGTWIAQDRPNSIMTITRDGKLYHTGQYVATVEIQPDNKVKMISNRKDVSVVEQIISYQISGAELKWGPNLDQTFIRFTDAKNTSYQIGNETITLVNGKYEQEAAPGSASKITTQIFGEPVIGDLNGDGKMDAAVMLTRTGAGTGTFFYVAAALQDPQNGQFVGTNAILLGDRIAPQNVLIDQGTITANYADRKPGEPMTTRPSVGVSKYLTVENADLVDITSSR